MRIQAKSDQAATMTLVWRANPSYDWPIAMQRGVAVIGYPRGGRESLLPLQHAVDGGREFLTAMDAWGASWLQCQRPVPPNRQ
jgi:hypothetical protein